MSEVIAFDTHRFVKRLTDTGFTEAQAEVLADEQVRLLNDNLATKQDLLKLQGIQKQDLLKLEGVQKQDLAELEAELQRQMAELKGELQRQMAELEAGLQRQMAELKGDLQRQMAELKGELLKWMIGAMIAQTGVIVGLVLGLT